MQRNDQTKKESNKQTLQRTNNQTTHQSNSGQCHEKIARANNACRDALRLRWPGQVSRLHLSISPSPSLSLLSQSLVCFVSTPVSPDKVLQPHDLLNRLTQYSYMFVAIFPPYTAALPSEALHQQGPQQGAIRQGRAALQPQGEQGPGNSLHLC